MSYYSRRRQSGSESEIEALQTDVMRFIAILGICLMVIFALVQALPVSSNTNQPDLMNKDLLEHQIEDLEKKNCCNAYTTAAA